MSKMNGILERSNFMGNLVALAPILLMVFLAIVMIGILFFLAKRASSSGEITAYEERIQALEEENRRLKENQRPQ